LDFRGECGAGVYGGFEARDVVFEIGSFGGFEKKCVVLHEFVAVGGGGA
jgi:hypothetical protein